eukprot:8798005-Heterocapsa_arctica.AAC.1
MGIHLQQPPPGQFQNPTVMIHQPTGDGSSHLVQWLEPRALSNPSLGQVGQEHPPVSPVVVPLIANEITGPPDGMVRP